MRLSLLAIIYCKERNLVFHARRKLTGKNHCATIFLILSPSLGLSLAVDEYNIYKRCVHLDTHLTSPSLK